LIVVQLPSGVNRIREKIKKRREEGEGRKKELTLYLPVGI
jgi:hypothetical protein